MKSTNRAALVLAALAGVVAAALVGWIAVLTVNHKAGASGAARAP